MPPISSHSPAMEREMTRLESKLRPTRDALASHWLFAQITHLQSLRTFMRSHVFAVWDFMLLLKALQRSFTCVDSPWIPVEDTDSSRFINQLVLAEESDEVRPGTFMSHLELYLYAMQEIGANREPIDQYLASLHRGADPRNALEADHIPTFIRDFVGTTISLAEQAPHQVAAAFLYGREDIIPDMFKELLAKPLFNPHLSAPVAEHMRRYLRRLKKHLWGLGLASPLNMAPGPNAFRLYLERHLELDKDEHGPLSRRLLMNLCGRDPGRWAEAQESATVALQARHRLWDSVAKEIVSGEQEAWEPIQDKPVLVFPAGR